MKIYIGTEFNGFNGELISMALVAEDGREFYAARDFNGAVNPWVEEHVIPFVNEDFLTDEDFQTDLANFLFQFENIEIIADWPEDIKHFCQWIIIGAGEMMPIGPVISLSINRTLDSGKSAIPHNALEDARAIMLAAETA